MAVLPLEFAYPCERDGRGTSSCLEGARIRSELRVSVVLALRCVVMYRVGSLLCSCAHIAAWFAQGTSRMTTPSRKRLMRDFKRLMQDPPAGISGAPQDNNIMLWNAVIFGYEL